MTISESKRALQHYETACTADIARVACVAEAGGRGVETLLFAQDAEARVQRAANYASVAPKCCSSDRRRRWPAA